MSFRPRRPASTRDRAPAPPISSHGVVGDDELVCGLRSGLALFTRRRSDILKVAFTTTVRAEIADLGRWATSEGLPCVEMGAEQLDRLAGSAHHEGLCVLARPRPWLRADQLAELLVRSRGLAIALDRVRNPYNVGAILRSAAYFGVDGAIIGAPAPHPGLPAIAVRVSEGGVEHLQCSRTTDLGQTLAKFRTRGIHVVGADCHAGRGARDFSFVRPTVLVLGHEREGLGARIRAACDDLVSVRGTGAIDSLNVAVAAGVLLSELAHRTGEPAQRRSLRDPT